VDAVVHFSASVLPLVQREIPEARFDIVGRNPTRPVLRLAGAPGVRVTGSVPDVRPYVRAAALSVAPFRIARGIQNKVLEAMALRRPVVGTPTGFQGTTATNEDGVRIVEDPAGMTSAIVQLLRDRDVRAACGERARAYVERNHRWEAHGKRLEQLLLRVTADQAPPPPGR
jgi:glycosyltransferase involved in cell wall biosynthesis